MSDVALMDGGEARERVERVKAAVDQARADLVELWRRRAWLSLGYQTWDDLCDAEFTIRVALPRDERQATVAELRQHGMSTRAIGSALGVNQATVVRDLASTDAPASVEQPERVVSLDGRERPASQPPRSAPVERYPELAHYEDRPETAERLADALDRYDDEQRARRREALAASIAADKRRAAQPEPAPEQSADRVVLDELLDLARAFRARLAEAADAAGRADLSDHDRAEWARLLTDVAHRAATTVQTLTRPNLRSVQ